jgi:hypothetical protein
MGKKKIPLSFFFFFFWGFVLSKLKKKPHLPNFQLLLTHSGGRFCIVLGTLILGPKRASLEQDPYFGHHVSPYASNATLILGPK